VKTDVILSTYNHPKWLQKVLWGFQHQTCRDFRLIVADDGSNEKTQEVITESQRLMSVEIQHVWHEDLGFRKCRILNKAIASSDAEYLIFTDGDCIPRRDFVEVHRRHAKAGHFLSGGAVRLPMELSRMISLEDISAGRAHDAKWLMRNGLSLDKKVRMLVCKSWSAKLLDRLPLTRPTWNGGNASAWRSDLIVVNGYDERMGHGGLDRELGERLVNYGLRPVSIRHQAVCIHLEHGRGYAAENILRANQELRHRTRTEKIVRTPAGIATVPERKVA